MGNPLIDKMKFIRAFIIDVDGVLTNGHILMLENGEQLRSFNIKDAYAMQYASLQRYRIGIVCQTGSEAIGKFFDSLGIKDVYFDLASKQSAFDDFLLDNSLAAGEVVYIGDDLDDLQPLATAGLSVCPADAVQEIKEKVHYVTSANGGSGCAREIIEMVLRLQNKWFEITE